MIYLVSAEHFIFQSEDIISVSVQESLKLLSSLKIVGLDTETTGLDPYTKDLKLVQLGCKEFQVVIDTTTINILEYKEFLESDRLFLLWNAKFDLKWFYKYGIIIQNVYDGFLAEKLMWLGYPAGIHSLSLKTAGQDYLGIELDKTVRGRIIYSKLDEEIIRYGANDVQWLEDIKDKQEIKLKEKGLLTAIDIENRFVRVLAYTEWCGVKLDTQKWQIKMKADKERENEALKKCNEWILKLNETGLDTRKTVNYLSDVVYDENWEPATISKVEGLYIKPGVFDKYIYIDGQGDLFSDTPFNLEPKVTINWNSAKQLIPIFKLFGVDVQVEDKEKGGSKDSIDAKTLKPQKDKCSLIPLYLEYKEAVKVTSTYGENFLEQINPISGRIHTQFHQLGTDTGKTSTNIWLYHLFFIYLQYKK